MVTQLTSLAASAAVCLASALAIALLSIALYIIGVVASFAVLCAKEFAERAHDRPPLVGTVFRQLKNFDRMFDEHVNYATAHRTSRIVYPGHCEVFTSDPAVVEHVLKNSFSKYSKVFYFNLSYQNFQPVILYVRRLLPARFVQTMIKSLHAVQYGICYDMFYYKKNIA